MIDQQYVTPIIVALISVAGTLLAPKIAALIKRRENGRIGSLAFDVKRVEIIEERTKQILDRQDREITELRTRVDELESERDELKEAVQQMRSRYDRILSTLSEVARELRGHLRDGDPVEESLPIADRLVRAISNARSNLL